MTDCNTTNLQTIIKQHRKLTFIQTRNPYEIKGDLRTQNSLGL